MTNKIKLIAVIILLSTFTIFAQIKDEKPKISEDLKKYTVELLHEISQDVAKLQSRTNRISYLLKVAGMLWESDKEESRDLYKTAMNEIIQDFAGFYSEELNSETLEYPKTSMSQMVSFHSLNTKLSFRRDLILELLKKDATLAENLFKKSFNVPVRDDFSFALDRQNKELQNSIDEVSNKKSIPKIDVIIQGEIVTQPKSKKTGFLETLSLPIEIRYQNSKSPISEDEIKRINDKLGKEKLTDEEKKNLLVDFRTQIPPYKTVREWFWLRNIRKMAKAGEVDFAIEILKESKLIVPTEKKTLDDVMLSLKLSTVYALIEPSQSFDILENTIPVLNSALEDYIKTKIFIESDKYLIQNGEIRMFEGEENGGFAKTMLRSWAHKEDTLRNLAKADFSRTIDLANKFSRPEIQVEIKLLIIKSLIDVKDEENSIYD